jgi:hypothetical protein
MFPRRHALGATTHQKGGNQFRLDSQENDENRATPADAEPVTWSDTRSVDSIVPRFKMKSARTGGGDSVSRQAITATAGVELATATQRVAWIRQVDRAAGVRPSADAARNDVCDRP